MRIAATNPPSHTLRLRVPVWLWWRVAACAWLALGAIYVFAGSGSQETSVKAPENQVKAAWMLNFTKFIEWPKSAFADGNKPCVVGVFGKDPFGPVIDTVFAKKLLQGRPFTIRRLARDSDCSGLHILFVPASERRAARDAMSKMGRVPVLTVGEFEDFHEHGGIINFVVKGDSVEFDIDLRNAQKAGLRIDANLLKIARKVRGRYE